MALVKGLEEVDKLNEKLYVAVSKEFKACKSVILWALQNSGAKRVCLIHVHQPAQTISILGAKFPISSLSEKEVRAYWEKEKQDMRKILDEYLEICSKAGVQAEKLYLEMDTVENGIMELISQHKIERLIMGAAADNRYSRKMMEPKSKKANYVRQHAPDFCHIWFICKGRLIYQRVGTKLSCLNAEHENQTANTKPRLTHSTSGWSTPISRTDSIGSFEDLDRSSTFSISLVSGTLRSPAGANFASSNFPRTEERSTSLCSLALPPRPEEKQHHSPIINIEGSMNDALRDQLDQAIADAEAAKQEAFQECMKRQKAEKETNEAILKAKATESFYYEESRRRKEIEEELAKAKEELENTRKQCDIALEELQVALDQKLMLETRVQKSDAMGKELEDKLLSVLELLQNQKKL